MSRPTLHSSVVTSLVLAGSIGLGGTVATRAFADTPARQTYFICPSVGLNNPNGMWVVGQHGGYYVNIPTQGLSIPTVASS